MALPLRSFGDAARKARKTATEHTNTVSALEQQLSAERERAETERRTVIKDAERIVRELDKKKVTATITDAAQAAQGTVPVRSCVARRAPGYVDGSPVPANWPAPTA